MFAENTQPEAVKDDDAAAVVRAVTEYIGQTGLTRTAIARSINIAASTLGLVLTGSYPGNRNKIVLDLDRWLEARYKRDAAPKASAFVWTRVAEEIKVVAETTVTLGTIGLVWSPHSSGVGKTMTLRAIAATTPGAMLVRAIARSVPVSDQGTTSLVYNRVKAKLAGSSRLLMIDQAHSLCGARDDVPLHTLADLHNATGAPQLWAATADLVGYLSRGLARGRESLTQVDSRIGVRRDLMHRVSADGGGDPLYSVEEIRNVFSRGKMRLAPDAARYLTELANLPDTGALRTCNNLVVIATKINQGDAEALTAAMLRAAHQMLVGSGYAVLEARLAAMQPPTMLKIRAG